MRLTPFPVLLFGFVFHFALSFPVFAQSSEKIFGEGRCDEARAEKQARGHDGWTTLTLAVLHNDQPEVKRLLEGGGNINTTDTFGRSLLFLAREHELDEMSRFLVERGANESIKPRKVDPSQHMPDARPLLKEPELQKTVDENKLSFVEAVRGGAVERVKSLLANGVSSETLNAKDRPPLYEATLSGNLEMVQVLVAAGCNPNQRFFEGTCSLLDIAYEYGYPDLVEYFEKEHHLKRTDPNPARRETRTTLIQSKDYDRETTTSEELSLRQFKIDEELFGYPIPFHFVAGEIRTAFYLSFKNSPDRILLDAGQYREGENRKPFGSRSDLTDNMKWLKKGRLAMLSWDVVTPGRGQNTNTYKIFLAVQGNRVREIFRSCSWGFGKSGHDSHYNGWEKWSVDPGTGDFVLTRGGVSDLTTNGAGQCYLTRMIALYPFDTSGTETEWYISLSEKLVYRFRLEGSKLVCVSAKQYLDDGNELPLCDIAAEYGISLKSLREQNPSMRNALFCNGPVLIGEIAPLKSQEISR